MGEGKRENREGVRLRDKARNRRGIWGNLGSRKREKMGGWKKEKNGRKRKRMEGKGSGKKERKEYGKWGI